MGAQHLRFLGTVAVAQPSGLLTVADEGPVVGGGRLRRPDGAGASPEPGAVDGGDRSPLARGTGGHPNMRLWPVGPRRRLVAQSRMLVWPAVTVGAIRRRGRTLPGDASGLGATTVQPSSPAEGVASARCRPSEATSLRRVSRVQDWPQASSRASPVGSRRGRPVVTDAPRRLARLGRSGRSVRLRSGRFGR